MSHRGCNGRVLTSRATSVTTGGPLKLDDDAQCNDCGRFGAFDLGDRHLCEDCYRGCGSCCPEFGGHDLWADEE